MYDCGTLTKLVALYVRTALNTKVDAMQPSGDTDVTIGLVWAWHALTSDTPTRAYSTASSARSPRTSPICASPTDGGVATE